jgi:periplasmic protein CpxP/Spy
MFLRTISATRTLATAVLLGSIALSCPLAIAAGDSAGSMADTSAATAPATTAPTPSESSRVEARIKELHNRLHITAAQQTQWDNLVQVMRDNANAMYALEKQRGQNASDMTAVDAVKSYQEVIQAHEAGMEKFLPAFEALYESMSDSQKKVADAMFQSRVRTAAGKARKAS